MQVHFSSDKQDWETPQDFFDKLNTEFHFTLDVCANNQNTKVPNHWFGVEQNALSQDWSPFICWMNPPYGREIVDWVRKASQEVQKGALVVALLPARTDTRWWWDYIQDKQEVRFIKGRLRFVGATASAPFPSVVVVFRKEGSFGS